MKVFPRHETNIRQEEAEIEGPEEEELWVL